MMLAAPCQIVRDAQKRSRLTVGFLNFCFNARAALSVFDFSKTRSEVGQKDQTKPGWVIVSQERQLPSGPKRFRQMGRSFMNPVSPSRLTLFMSPTDRPFLTRRQKQPTGSRTSRCEDYAPYNKQPVVSLMRLPFIHLTLMMTCRLSAGSCSI